MQTLINMATWQWISGDGTTLTFQHKTTMTHYSVSSRAQGTSSMRLWSERIPYSSQKHAFWRIISKIYNFTEGQTNSPLTWTMAGITKACILTSKGTQSMEPQERIWSRWKAKGRVSIFSTPAINIFGFLHLIKIVCIII